MSEASLKKNLLNRAIPTYPAADTLSFTMSRKNISNDQQRIYEKGYNEIALEKSECAEQQTNYY